MKKPNIFFKSVLRQPARTILLAALMAVAAFAFVARVTEFAIVNDEINRIEDYHNAIVMLSAITPQDITNDQDVTDAMQIIVDSPLVAYDDPRVFVQGIMHGVTNVTSNFGGLGSSYFVPSYEGADIVTMDNYFLGTARMAPRLISGMNRIQVEVNVDQLIVGCPQTIRDTEATFISASGQEAVLNTRLWLWLAITPEEAVLFAAGEWNPFEGVRHGEQYLFRVQPALNVGGMGSQRDFFIRPLMGGDDGLRQNPFSIIGTTAATIHPNFSDNREDMMFFAPASQADEILALIDEEVSLTRDNISSMMVIGTRNMETVPRFQNRLLGRLQSGRWLTLEDYENANPVAVLPIQMATRRGVGLGDTLTLTLRDNPRPNWIDVDTVNRWNVGIEGWWAPMPQGWWATTERSNNWRNYPTYEITVEVVGLYFNTPSGQQHNFLSTEMYVPLSIIPDGFGWDDSPQLTTMYSFVLNSPRDTDSFIAAHSTELEQLGFGATFLPNEFATFAAAADPIRDSILLNMLIFAFVSVLILAMVVFLYLKQWRKALAVSRALGSPANSALKNLFTPVFAIWTPAILVGAGAAWFFAIVQANNTLYGLAQALGEEAGVFTRSPLELAVFAAAMLLLTFGGLVIAGFSIAKKPVLVQLQGGVQKKSRPQNNQKVESGTVPVNFVVGNMKMDLSPLPTQKSRAKASHLRFVKKHILRSPFKSILTSIVAMFFVVSLVWLNYTIDFTEQEIDRLWNTTVVNGEVIRNLDDDQNMNEMATIYANAPITQTVVDSFLATGFVGDMYLEALWQFSVMRSQSYFDNDFVHPLTGVNFTTMTQVITAVMNSMDVFMGISNFDDFVRENSRNTNDDAMGILGEDIEITFASGLGADDFVFGGADAVVPVIVHTRFLERFGYNVGDYLMVDYPEIRTQIIASYNYGPNRSVNRFGERNIVILPLEALQYHTADSWYFSEDGWGLTAGLTYMTMQMNMNTARNRELETLPSQVGTTLARNDLGGQIGVLPLELVMNDQQLRDVISAMQQNLDLLRILYPIAIGVAALLSFGLALLIMLQNAKNAAIMRVLGKPRSTSQLVLSGEQIIVCLVGVLAGIVTLLIMSVSVFALTPLLLAAMYFIGSGIGSFIGAIIISSKTPLEMLQVKE